MDDKKIIELFFSRDEAALNETKNKYGNLCYYIASNILTLKEDTEEVVNDVLLSLWNRIPPERPENLRAYIGQTTKNHALNRSRDINAWKRRTASLSAEAELLEIIPDGIDLTEQFESKRAVALINEFLDKCAKDDRVIFVLRFWAMLDYPEISKQTGFGLSKIKMSVKRTKAKLAAMLEKEGIIV